MNIKIINNQKPKKLPKESEIHFGTDFSDHMFIMDYNPEKGWHNACIMPYGDLSISPAAMVFHYGQEMFEGMKAYRTPKGIALFRPGENLKRFNNSCGRMCMPELDIDFVIDAIKQLVKLDERWVLPYPDTSLYLRPFIIATDHSLAVEPSKTFKFIIICSPCRPMYGLDLSKVYVEDNYVRTVRGMLGYTKAGANYVGAMCAQEYAHEQGFDQVLWLDGVEQKYIEEVGAMNIFFVIGDEVITPELGGTILSGVTRKSVIELLRKRGYKVSERKISIDEVQKAYKEGRLKEAFGTGTGAVILPMGTFKYNNNNMIISKDKIGKITKEVYNTLTGIQFGKLEDEFGWTLLA